MRFRAAQSGMDRGKSGHPSMLQRE